MSGLAEPGRRYITPLGRECVALSKPPNNLDSYPFAYINHGGGFFLRWVNVPMLKPVTGDEVIPVFLARFGRAAG